MKLHIARSALEDLKAIKAYYQEQGVPEVGLRLVVGILEKAHRLIQHPDLGRKVPEFDQEQIRELIHPPYRVVYLRDALTVSLVRVWRSERMLLLPQDC